MALRRRRENCMKKSTSIFIIIMLIIVALIVTGIILYDKTIWFKRFIAWWSWAYNGLKKFHWDTFVYP